MIKKCRLKTSCYGLNTLHLDPDLEIAPIWIRIRVHKHGKFWEKNPVKTELIKNDLFVEKTLNKLTTKKIWNFLWIFVTITIAFHIFNYVDPDPYSECGSGWVIPNLHVIRADGVENAGPAMARITEAMQKYHRSWNTKTGELYTLHR